MNLREIDELRNSVANAEAVATKATLRAEKAEGELACVRAARANDDNERRRLWESLVPYLSTETHGKTWAEIIKLYAEREKKALGERDAAARHRDDLLAIIKRDQDLMAATGVKESLLRDAIPELAAQRDAARAELAALREKPAYWDERANIVAALDEAKAGVVGAPICERIRDLANDRDVAKRIATNPFEGDPRSCKLPESMREKLAAEPKPEPSDWREKLNGCIDILNDDREVRRAIVSALLWCRDGIDEALRLRGGK